MLLHVFIFTNKNTIYRKPNLLFERSIDFMKIEINHLNMIYPGGKQALKDISFTLQSPNLIGLLGPNGAGKSTLMQLLVAALKPTSGSILLNGTSLTQCETQLKSSLGYLPQNFGLYQELTIQQFLDYMAALKNIPNSKQAIQKALESTNLQALNRTRIRTLSGGQKQRVGIAQALLGDPSFLIFDEPTVGLDPEERLNFRNLFSSIAKEKERLVLLSTHIIEDIHSVSSQLIVIHEGEICFLGTAFELISQTASDTLEDAYLKLIHHPNAKN